MIGSINREKLQEELNIPARYHISLVLALGTAKEKIILEEIGTDGSIKYYRDENNVHHVPKRSLDEIIVSF